MDTIGTRYGGLLEAIRVDLEELVSSGSMSRARELARLTGQHLNHNEYPLYFTGDLDAEIVLVHLNPKQPDNHAERYAGEYPHRTLEEYVAYCSSFGERAYGPASPRTHRSRFDAKQIRFLRPFGVIDFVEEHGPEDRFTNMERVVDRKLQMELIPYGSDAFHSAAFPPVVIKPHFDRLLSVIAAAPRRYVLFCGRVFEPLLAGYVTQTHEFRLARKDGESERARSSFANLRIPAPDGTVVHAGLCHSWARQGIPMTAYAREVVARYASEMSEVGVE